MPQASVANEVNAFGISFRRTTTVTTDGSLVKDPSLDAAKVGALTTRTDNDTGTLTMAADHGITTGQRLDVYWSGGSRYGMTVGTVATNEVPIDGGDGDNLPAEETAITAMVPRLETFAVPAADLNALFVGCGAAAATAVFRSSVPANVVVVETTGAAGSYHWDEASGVTTPFGADVADVYVSHGDSAQAWPVNVVAMID